MKIKQKRKSLAHHHLHKGSASTPTINRFVPFKCERDPMGRLMNKNFDQKCRRLKVDNSRPERVFYKANMKFLYDKYTFPIHYIRDEIQMHPGNSDLKLNKIFQKKEIDSKKKLFLPL